MVISRRGFLGLLFSAGIMAAEARSATPPKGSNASPQKGSGTSPTPQQKAVPNTSLLIDSYLPILKVNEGKRLHFYHKSGDKVTVGYGTNVESNPGYLAGVPIFYNGKALTAEERKKFLDTMASKKNAELANYSISASDAQKMAVRGMRDAILALAANFAVPNDMNFFYNLPLCMQALCVDVFYNVGRKGFRSFQKFQAAIRQKNFNEAVSQSVVYTNTTTKETNIKREWMKKRLLSVMQIVQAHPLLKIDALTELIKKDYLNTPFKKREQVGANLEGELSMARGEWNHMRRKAVVRAAPSAAKTGTPSPKDKVVPRSAPTSVKKPVAKSPAPKTPSSARPKPRVSLKDKAVFHPGVARRGSER